MNFALQSGNGRLVLVGGRSSRGCCGRCLLSRRSVSTTTADGSMWPSWLVLLAPALAMARLISSSYSLDICRLYVELRCFDFASARGDDGCSSSDATRESTIGVDAARSPRPTDLSRRAAPPRPPRREPRPRPRPRPRPATTDFRSGTATDRERGRPARLRPSRTVRLEPSLCPPSLAALAALAALPSDDPRDSCLLPLELAE